ncbi:exodeoxyribonuclease V subunit gamma [Thermodesulfobacteriota bacterium]
MPGIHLYTSNRLEALAGKLAELLNSAPLPPLKKEIILVQSRGMERWLALETASSLQIWAHCECPFPNTFIRNIYKLFMPEISDTSPYDKECITWHLMDIIPGLLETRQFEKVRQYLKADHELKLYQLAREVADLFDQYTLFRPDMVLDWEAETNTLPVEHRWQYILWLHLIERLQKNKNIFEFHRARLLHFFEEKILDPDFNAGQLPKRISVFGISSLPPYHLRVLAALAHHSNVHLFIMNPCQEFWFDIIADRDIVKISRKAAFTEELLHLEHGNKLLSSMGHLGRDFLALVQGLECREQELFLDPGSKTLLSCIQQDILYLQENNGKSLHSSETKKKINSNDTSIIFQSCHSPMREVEVLHDQLLEIFEQSTENDAIEPKDILVMAPDINEYTSFIRAVFDAGQANVYRLPFSISDQSLHKTSKYIDAFFEILSLYTSRFNSIDVLGLLKTEPVRKRFAITDQDILTLERWISQTRICWGIDQAHKRNINLPDYIENTWRAGLNRLLLGYAVQGDEKALFENILPYDPIEGSDRKLLGNFLDYTESLFGMKEILMQKHTLAEWSELLLLLQDTFLLADGSFERDNRLLQQSLYGLRELQSQTSFKTLLSIDVVQSFLLDSLEQHHSSITSGANFLTGNITFCSMLPMRAIPFKVVCLLGMNDGLYPRPGNRRSFDLMHMDPKPGDRSRRYDDRYLFLETILSARKKLIISYTGQSIDDGTKIPPSVLVSELLDYIKEGYEIKDRDGSSDEITDHLTTYHRLQPFHPDYFRAHNDITKRKFFSYSRENCDAAIAFTSKPQKECPVVSSPLSATPDVYKQVELNELIKFFSHPARYLLVKKIGIAVIEETRIFETSEPFVIKGLERYKLENDILKQLMEGHDCEKLYEIKKAAGILPHGRTGEIHFTQTLSAVQSFKRILDSLLSQQKIEQQEVNLSVNDYRISGRLENLSETGMVQYRYATIKPKDVIRAWISHLVLNSIENQDKTGSEAITYLAGKDRIYKYSPVAENKNYLEQLLNFYLQGQSEPLHFFPRSSFVFAREIHKGAGEQKALHKARQEWEGDVFTKNAEKNAPYNSLLYKNMDLTDSLFIDQAKKIFLPVFDHLCRATL